MNLSDLPIGPDDSARGYRLTTELGHASQGLYASLRALVTDHRLHPDDPFPPRLIEALREEVCRFSAAARALGVPSEQALRRIEAGAVEAGCADIRGAPMRWLSEAMARWCLDESSGSERAADLPLVREREAPPAP